MAYQQNLCDYYEELVEESGKQIVQRLARSWIRQLQKIKRENQMMQSPEDSGLVNLWDEICVQIQEERSIFWDLYEDYLRKMICSQLEERCSRNELEILWCQTKLFQELAEEEEGLSGKNSPPWKGICMEELTDWCLSKLLDAAADYGNERIEKYIYH